MITEQQRANHNMHAINEIEHLIRSIRKVNPEQASYISGLLDGCFLIDDDLKYTKVLKRTYLTACQAFDNLKNINNAKC